MLTRLDVSNTEDIVMRKKKSVRQQPRYNRNLVEGVTRASCRGLRPTLRFVGNQQKQILTNHRLILIMMASTGP